MLSTFYTACVLMTAPITVLASANQSVTGKLTEITRILGEGTAKVATLGAEAILEYGAFVTCAAIELTNADKSLTTCSTDKLDAFGTALGKCSGKAPATPEVVSGAVKRICVVVKNSCASTNMDCVAWNKLAGNAGSLTVLATVALLVFTL